MKRRVIKIDEEKCNGCGICAEGCHEGAIGMVDGKAKLLRDDYCDGLGDCLPSCPVAAITFEEREAADYDVEAVKIHMEKKKKEGAAMPLGCPGSMNKKIERSQEPKKVENSSQQSKGMESQLNQWPVQIKLVSPNAAYFQGSKLLIAADCTAYAYANFHNDFIKNRVTIIGCPKLDEGDYAEKLTEILKLNEIKDVKIVRMEVPCCGGIVKAAQTALQNCGKMIPWQVVTISTSGDIID